MLQNTNLTSTMTIRCMSCGARTKAMCSALDCQELIRLNEIAVTKTYKAGAALMEEGENVPAVFNVVSGVIRLSRLMSDGRRAVTGFVFPGDFLGVTIDRNTVMTAEAINDVEVCRIERSRLNTLFQDIPKLEHRLLEMTFNELIIGRDHMVLLARKTLRERLASFLINFTERLREDERNPPTLKLPMARSDIADYLGVTVETISRCLAGMAEEGIVQLLSPRRIVLLEQERLSRIADGENI